MKDEMGKFVKELQHKIVQELSKIDGKEFLYDHWEREEGGEGISCVLQDGNVFEKAGVLVSIVHGELPEKAIEQMRSRRGDIPQESPLPFFAAGISLVVHPHNPKAPTVHLNYRYFELTPKNSPRISWVGGGSDLTPSYLYEEDARHFHQTFKPILEDYQTKLYGIYKKWCDKYFYLPHRQEHRGIGGIFFDDLTLTETNTQKTFQLLKSLGENFLPSYLPIVKRRKDEGFTEQEKIWQQVRRGRYIEFNLLYDRGTKFGLNTPNARVESILLSLPLTARWEYLMIPQEDSWEWKTLQVLKNPVDWVPLD